MQECLLDAEKALRASMAEIVNNFVKFLLLSLLFESMVLQGLECLLFDELGTYVGKALRQASFGLPFLRLLLFQGAK